jgi:hypothetical protein
MAMVRPARRRICLRNVFSLLWRTIAAARRAPMGQWTSRVARVQLAADLALPTLLVKK